MTRIRSFLSLALCLAVHVGVAPAQPPKVNLDDYHSGPDSKPQPGVPKGKTFSFPLENSRVFPNTTRRITVYVPAQYAGEKPACVYVGLDGLGFGVPVVFDNLIHAGDMPVTIAVGVSPGRVASRTGENPRFNRSFEFDGLNDALARLIVDEVLPAVEARKTPDGLPIKLSRDPNDRCTGGGSTGGIAAFTLAWERPDQFRRVFSAIGTFVGMRGGDRYPVLVRKTEPKPIRVFQQDGENDQWMGGPEVGDWWMGNVTLDRSLEFAGYDHRHVWGTGPHSGRHATAIFPDAMRYLWKDWPKPIEARVTESKNVILSRTIDPESGWERVEAVGESCDHVIVHPNGDVYFRDTATNRTRRLDSEGRVSDAEQPADRVFAFTSKGEPVAIDGFGPTCVSATSDGSVYATDAEAGKVWLVRPDGSRTLLDEELERPTAVGLTPDGLWLTVIESGTHWGYSYRVAEDGTVDSRQRFYWSHVPDRADDSGAADLSFDTNGHMLVATHMGVQIFDRNGRSRGILPMPVTNRASSVCFGGPKFDTLYATSGGRLFKRRMKSIGAPSFIKPVKLPGWGAG